MRTLLPSFSKRSSASRNARQDLPASESPTSTIFAEVMETCCSPPLVGFQSRLKISASPGRLGNWGALLKDSATGQWRWVSGSRSATSFPSLTRPRPGTSRPVTKVIYILEGHANGLRSVARSPAVARASGSTGETACPTWLIAAHISRRSEQKASPRSTLGL